MRVTKYLFLVSVVFRYEFSIFPGCSCCQNCFKTVLSPEEKRKLELEKLKLKAERAAEFKNKLFAIEADRADFYSKLLSQFTCVKIGREEFNTNFDVIKNLPIVETKRADGLNVIIPNCNLDNQYHKYSFSEKLIILKDEGVVVYFFYENDKKTLYIYHKGIKNKLNFNSKNGDLTIYIKGYTYVAENIDFSNSLYFIGDLSTEMWLVRKCKFISDDLMSVTFHKEKDK